MKSNKHNIPGIIIIMNSRYFDKYVNYDNNVQYNQGHDTLFDYETDILYTYLFQKK